MPPVNARVVPSQPGEAQDQLEVSQREHLKGKGFSMVAMDAKLRGEKVSDRASGGTAAINEFNWDGLGKGGGVQMMQRERADGSMKESEAPESTSARQLMGGRPGTRSCTKRER